MYVNSLNIAEEQYAEAVAKKDLAAAIALQPAIKFHGGVPVDCATPRGHAAYVRA